MALNDLTGQRIKNTYNRLVQTEGGQYADGTGSLLDIASTADIPSTGSLLTTASVSLNTITFEKGDGSTFPITVDTGSGGVAPGEVVDDVNGLSGSITLASTDTDLLTVTEAGQTINLNPIQPKKVIGAVKNISGGTLLKGTPVHVTASASPPSGFLSEVVAADAGDAGLMPAHYILAQDLDDGEEGDGIIIGKIQGVDTSAFGEGDTLYVASGSGYTNTKPTGSTNLIQNIGVVTKVDAVNGGGEVFGAGRSNDLPNLLEGYVWIGTTGDVPVPTTNVPSATTATKVSVSSNDSNQAQPILFAVAGEVPGSTTPRIDNNYNPGELQFTYNPEQELLSVNEITSSVANITSITGSLLGTASFADNATSASYSLTASLADDATSASFASTATSASHALRADEADEVYFDTSTEALNFPVPYTTVTTAQYAKIYTDSSAMTIRPSDGAVRILNNGTVGGTLGVTGELSGTTADFSGAVTSSDVQIDGFPSVSASLAGIPDGITFNGSTNDGLLSYNSATTVDVSSGFTTTGTLLNVRGNSIIVPFEPTSSPGGTGWVLTDGNGPGGVDTAITAGDLYYFSSNRYWELADANDETKASSLLAIALENGKVTMLIQGYVQASQLAGFTTGRPLYVSTTGGDVQQTPPSTTGTFVRKCGYSTNGGTRLVYFDGVSYDYFENT